MQTNERKENGNLLYLFFSTTAHKIVISLYKSCILSMFLLPSVNTSAVLGFLLGRVTEALISQRSNQLGKHSFMLNKMYFSLKSLRDFRI